jgi:hypothetical protein
MSNTALTRRFVGHTLFVAGVQGQPVSRMKMAQMPRLTHRRYRPPRRTQSA